MPPPDIVANLRDFTKRFSTEEGCAEYLFAARWPTGFVCPRCGTAKGYRIEGRAAVECASAACRYQVRLTAGTVMHRSKQDLTTWFHAAYLVSTLTPGISALQFQRQLGLSRYETAFNMLHKLRSALVVPEREPLHVEVEVDEAYIGGTEEGSPGRRAQTKALVVCAVELVRWIEKKTARGRRVISRRRVRTGRVRLQVIGDASAQSLLPFVKQSVAKGAIVHTDGWPGYASLRSEGYDHRPVVQGTGKEAKCMPHIHLIFSNLKTWLLGTHHGRVSAKHLQAYLNEYTFRFNRRFWRGPAFLRALGLSAHASDRPTYDGLYHAGEPGGWKHPGSPTSADVPAPGQTPRPP